MTRRAALLISGFCFLASGCELGNEPNSDLTVTNETGRYVLVSFVENGEEPTDQGVGIHPGTSDDLIFPPGIGEGECTDHDAVAATPDGDTVDRQESRICHGDEWVIDGN